MAWILFPSSETQFNASGKVISEATWFVSWLPQYHLLHSGTVKFKYQMILSFSGSVSQISPNACWTFEILFWLTTTSLALTIYIHVMYDYMYMRKATEVTCHHFVRCNQAFGKLGLDWTEGMGTIDRFAERSEGVGVGGRGKSSGSRLLKNLTRHIYVKMKLAILFS